MDDAVLDRLEQSFAVEISSHQVDRIQGRHQSFEGFLQKPIA